jgi:uracil-DNA glycosylase
VLRCDRYTVPKVDVDANAVRIIMVSEAPPAAPEDDFYAPGTPDYLVTTLQAFRAAGVEAASMQDILDLGVYITTAVKCAKVEYGIKAAPIRACSHLLEAEIGLFPNVRAIMLMGDVAIKAMNYIARRQTGQRVIPSGSTYKIRGNEYTYGDVRVFPSYLQTGKSFLIEKSKQRMIAEDLMAALALAG